MPSDNDPLNFVTANRFYVEIENRITASFAECSGVGYTVKNEKIMEGGVNDQQRILLGQTEFDDVTLSRGITKDLVFMNWIGNILTSRTSGNKLSDFRRNVNILMFNQAGETMQCWTLIGAVPVGWKGPSLAADSSSVAMEELTIAYEGLSIKDGSNRSGSSGAVYPNGRGTTGYYSSS